MDPATVDRRTSPIIGIAEEDLPTRRMSIAGIGGGMDARVLSKDFSGPATRLVRIPPNWGTTVPGFFTASVGFFVVNGGMIFGDVMVRSLDYVFVPESKVITGLRSVEPTLALVMTAGPVRYETTADGGSAELKVARYQEGDWKPLPEQPGRFVRNLWDSPLETTWLGAARDWSYDTGPWHRHDTIEEFFVLKGHISFVDMEERDPVLHSYSVGGYGCRPAGTLHVGPGSGSSEDTLMFHRSLGPLTTDWVLLDRGDEGDSEPKNAS